ncbi:10038_t:CDS:2, partial [Acaulospora colombiana]
NLLIGLASLLEYSDGATVSTAIHQYTGILDLSCSGNFDTSDVSLIAPQLFPILEFIFHSIVPNKELIPDLLFSCLSILICLLCIRTQFGITTLINTPSRNIILPQTHSKLIFFQDLNMWLTISLFVWNVPALFLCVYSLFIQPNGPNGNLSSRFIIDFLSANSTFGQFIAYIILISVVYPDFSTCPSSSKRTISSPYNLTKPKIPDHSNFDVGEFHEMNHHHMTIDIPHQDTSPVHSDSNSSTSSLSEETSQTKSSHSKYSATSTSHLRHNKKRHSKRLKSRGGSNGRIEKSDGSFSRKRKKTGEVNGIHTSTTPLMPMGGSAIEDALAQQIIVETRKDVMVEPAYMHAYINPHIPSPRYPGPSTNPGSRPTSTTNDLLLAPLPTPYSEFAVTKSTNYHPSTTGKNGGSLSHHRNSGSHGNNSLFQQLDSGTSYDHNSGDAHQRSVRSARSTTPPIPRSPSQGNQQNRSQGQGNSMHHQQIYSPSPQYAAHFRSASLQQPRVTPSRKRSDLSSNQDKATLLSRSSTNRNSMASSNDGDGSGISEDESERNRTRVKRASWHQQMRGHEETLSEIRENGVYGGDGNQPLNSVFDNEQSYVEQLRGRRSMSGSVSEDGRKRRQESGSESNSLSRRVSGSSRRSASETKEYDGHLRPPTSTRSLRSSSNRDSWASHSA